jgi:hypothetical protein
MPEQEDRAAFYAAAPGPWRDWWTLLHPPYTAWHLSYVVIGASLAPHTDATRLVATVLAFFLAVGIAAHALDEVHGHPLRTSIPDAELWLAACISLLGAVVLGVVGLSRVGLGLLAFIVVGPILVAAYNLEWFGGLVHTDVMFALAWGSFPLLTGYYAQAESLGAAAFFGAAAAFALSYAQRTLSTPARRLRRQVTRAEGTIAMEDGSVLELNRHVLLQPLERALRSLSWSVVSLAVALAIARVL